MMIPSGNPENPEIAALMVIKKIDKTKAGISLKSKNKWKVNKLLQLFDYALINFIILF